MDNEKKQEGMVMRKGNRLNGTTLGLGFIGILISAFVVAWLLLSVFAIVPAGHVGVADTFGQVEDSERQPGFHFKLPITAIVPMSYQTQEISETAAVPSKEGLIVTLDTTILYRLNPEVASDVYKTIGMNYVDVVMRPQFRSAIREVTARYEAKSLYTEGRESISSEIYSWLEPKLKERGIIIEKVLLRELTLPEKVTTAIEVKLEAEQQAEQMQFVLQKEEQEKDRKIIEAEGISKANEIIAGSLSNAYLTWYWIDNLDDHESVIYVPIGEMGLPLFKEVDHSIRPEPIRKTIINEVDG